MAKPDSVQIEREFAATPAEVWRAWTDSTLVRRWFGSDPAGKVLAASLDVRVEGSFAVTFVDSDGTEHTCSGEYREVQPTTTLGFSWRWRSEPGVETAVTVSLEPVGRMETRMVFEHAKLGAASLHDYAAGWRRTFDKLERVLREMRD